jgi:hypothetical protein
MSSSTSNDATDSLTNNEMDMVIQEYNDRREHEIYCEDMAVDPDALLDHYAMVEPNWTDDFCCIRAIVRGYVNGSQKCAP